MSKKSETIPEGARRAIDAVEKAFARLDAEAAAVKRQAEADAGEVARKTANPKARAEADGKAAAERTARIRRGARE